MSTNVTETPEVSVRSHHDDDAPGAVAARTLRAAPRVAAFAVVLIAGAALVGWMFDVWWLKTVVRDAPQIKANTACALLFAGTSLWLLSTPWRARGGKRRHLAARLCAVVVAAAGVIILGEYLSGRDFGIDQIFFRDVAAADGSSAAHPGRPTLNTAFALLLAGIALLSLRRRGRVAPTLVQACALVTLLSCLLVFTGFIYQATFLYGIPVRTGMPPHTLSAFVLLALGVLLAEPERGIAGAFLRDDAGGMLARRLLPAVVGIPLALGWLRLKAQGAGWFTTEYGTASLVIAVVVVLALVVWRSAVMLSRTDTLRRRAEESLRRANIGLEAQVAVRTAELTATNTRLRTSEARARALFESPVIGVVFADIYGHINGANDAILDLLGYTRADLEDGQLDWRRLTLPEHAAASERAIADARAHGFTRPFEKEYLRKDGTRVPILVGLTMLDEQREQIAAFMLDLTERKRGEAERARLLKREQAARRLAEESNRLKDEFLATVSHELRTPLMAIVGWARVLRDGTADAANAARAIEIIDRNSSSLSQLIEDLLDISRIVSGKLRLEVRPLALASVIEAALDTVRPAADARAIRLEVVTDPQPGCVSGDPDRLQQIVWNLLINAIKFTPRGGRVRVALRPVNAHVELSVSDTGQGIAAEFLPHVFDRFRQGDSSTTRAHGGLGLGLSIVRHLIELHGGTVVADSRGLGAGATFTVQLPRLTDARRDEPAPKKVNRTAGDHGGEIVPALLTGVRVLAVDDEPEMLELLRSLLEPCGALVRTADSAAEAFAAFRELPPDVLLSDIGMTDEDGYHLLARVRALAPAQGGQVPAVALTAYAHVADRLRSFDAGFQLHIAKPVEPTKLVAAIARLVEQGEAINHDHEAHSAVLPDTMLN